MVMGSAQAVDDASAMMTNAAEASITRWKIWGIVSGDSLSSINLATVEVRVLIRQGFQDLQDVLRILEILKSCLKPVILELVE